MLRWILQVTVVVQRQPRMSKSPGFGITLTNNRLRLDESSAIATFLEG
jgi:hypothetical protein